MGQLSVALLCAALLSAVGADEMAVGVNGEEEAPMTNVALRFTNLSPRRSDLYWDDGRTGVYTATVEPGEDVSISSFEGHGFFWTKHGVSTPIVGVGGNRVEHVVASRAEEGASQAFALPASSTTQTGCYDRFKGCAQMAGRGECDDAPGWMIMHCPVACNACNMTDPAVRCPRTTLDMDSEPHWNAGDLNAMFERASTAAEFQAFEPVVLSSPAVPRGGDNSPPWVLRFDKFITAEEAAALVAQVDGAFARSTDVGEMDELGEAQKVISTGRTSENAWCSPACMANAHVANISKRIFDVTQVPQPHYEAFQVLKCVIIASRTVAATRARCSLRRSTASVAASTVTPRARCHCFTSPAPPLAAHHRVAASTRAFSL